MNLIFSLGNFTCNKKNFRYFYFIEVCFRSWNFVSPHLQFYLLFYNILFSFTIYIIKILFSKLSTTLGDNLYILDDKNCKRGDNIVNVDIKKFHSLTPSVALVKDCQHENCIKDIIPFILHYKNNKLYISLESKQAKDSPENSTSSWLRTYRPIIPPRIGFGS